MSGQKVVLSDRALTALRAIKVQSSFASAKHVELSRNKLTDLNNIDKIFPGVQTLDVRENHFENATAVLPALQQLKYLTALYISLPTDEDEDELVVGLPTLTELNGMSLVSDQNANLESEATKKQSFWDNHEVPEITLEEHDLELSALVFGAIKNQHGNLTAQAEQELTDNFDAHVSRVIRELGETLQHEHNTFIRQNKILRAKMELYDVCFKELCSASASLTMNQAFPAAIRKLHKAVNEIASSWEIVMDSTIPFYQTKLTQLEKDLAHVEKENSNLLELSEALERDAREAEQQRDDLKKELQELKEQYAASHDESQSEQTESEIQKPNSQKSRKSQVSASGSPRATHSHAKQKTHTRQRESSSTKSSTVADAPKSLTLKQLKDMIELIYASKTRFDERCKRLSLPFETMEQHMYTYLNQRYGLRPLIVGHAAAIIRGVNEFSMQDNDVRVFGCILRNDIDEDFRFVQSQLKHTVEELLRIHLRGQFPMKDDTTISGYLNKRINGTIGLAECKDIIKYMYAPSDSNQLWDILRKHDSAENHRGTSSIKYDRFVSHLLNFQLKGHLRFLQPIRTKFRDLDTDRDGTIDKQDFLTMLKQLQQSNPGEFHINSTQSLNTTTVTFSQAVRHVCEKSPSNS